MDTSQPAFREWVAEKLPHARWFAGKGRGGQVRAVRFLDEWTSGDEPIRSWAAEVEFPDGNVEAYHLVVEHAATGPREPTSDGWQRLWQSMAHRLRDAPGLPAAAQTWAATPVTLVTGEQTHTSFLVGEVAIVKVYRHINLDATPLPVRPHITAQAPVPRQYATFGADQRHLVLLTVTQQISNAVDGWQLATHAATAGISFDADAAALGRALRLVHEDLQTAPFHQHLTGADIADQMTQRLAAAARDIPALRPHLEPCRRVFTRLAGQQVVLQNVHGDFHLGQTLRDPDDQWWIVDFDGEPLTPAAERLAPDSRWRDVAGMLRSFDYAARVGEAREGIWQADCRGAFLRGYLPGEAELTSEETAQIVAYEVDKAVYDVRYETHHRPSWVPLALSALTDLLERLGEC